MPGPTYPFLFRIATTSATTLSLLLAAAVPTSRALALDLKIDLPPEASTSDVVADGGLQSSDGVVITPEQLRALEAQDQRTAGVPVSPVTGTRASDWEVNDPVTDAAIQAQHSQEQREDDHDQPPPGIFAPNPGAEELDWKRLPRVGESQGNPGPAEMRRAERDLSRSGAFPTPSCLRSNVAFWERIYSDVEVNEALVHDKEDLSHVYALVSMSQNRLKGHQAGTYEAYFRSRLRALASQINEPSTWDRSLRDLASRFRPGELTAARLLRASENLRLQSGLKSRFEAGVQRSLRYLPTIHALLKRERLPADVMVLPHVESSYFRYARSKVGAVGLWQLMPGTMRMLLGARNVGQRTDPAVSTLAAAKLLRQNFEATRSWPLALTAYNHGLAGVMRGMRATRSADLCEIIDKYSSPSFRFASGNFYAQFLAARNVASQRYRDLARTLERNPRKDPVLRQALLSTKGNL